MSTYNLSITATSAFFEVESNFVANKIESIFLSQFVKMAILKLNSVAVFTVSSVTCDGSSTNTCALKHLGCSFSENPLFQSGWCKCKS